MGIAAASVEGWRHDGGALVSFYAAMAKAASRLVEEYGMEARWYSTDATFDPVTGKNTSSSDTAHLAQSVFVETDVSLVDGSRIESGRKVILMDGAQTPTTGWKLDADYTDGVPAAGSFPGAVSGGVRGRWTVVEVKEINPAGIPLLYELQVMQ